ncbi:peptidoglycan DD-metalloendopeptidase family protein, partial [Peptococcaceae bacterium]|nr:peptidoglycan DD-metalloendopeptidase family protein [Peptococcaceae bacterium]
NPWDIATNHDISVERLQELNPSLKPESVQIGQVINLSDRQPLINVIHTFEEVVAEKIKAPLQVKRDDKMLKGHSKIVQPGADGLKEVKYKIITKNGVETEQVVLSENIIKEPVARIEQKGTRMLVASRNFGGGRLAKPSEGVVVSPFGMRRGRMHTGVDFGASHGSAVVAAEAGRVIRAGWFGGYGLCVDISHGNGMVTRYAHLSNIKVSVGNNVQRTQVIGAVGNTGNSTGPHLHFEVLKNGSPQNPLNYL